MKLKVPHGGFLAGLQMYSPHFRAGPAKICGPAHTIRMVHAADAAAPRPEQHFADSITPGSVVFISQPKGLVSACWGGLMSTRAKRLGAEGVVIDGKFRDVNEHRALEFGVFAKATSILGSNTFTRASEINVPLDYEIEEIPDSESVAIKPGDIILGDADGVVSIPVGLLAACIELCKERAAIDNETLESLAAGAEMGPTIARLRK